MDRESLKARQCCGWEFVRGCRLSNFGKNLDCDIQIDELVYRGSINCRR